MSQLPNPEPIPHPTIPSKRDYLLSDKTYDFLKRVVTLLLPAFATLYWSLASIWGLPNADQVVATTAAIATFLGVILTLGSKSYSSSDAKYDGQIVVTQDDEGTKSYSLELNGDPYDLDTKGAVAFKVQS